MKKLITLLALAFCLDAGAQIITTVAGNGTGADTYPCPTCYGGDGGQATAAKLFNPSGVAIDAAGNLYIADQQNFRVRKVSTLGIISTIVGNGTYGYSGDGGQATAAKLNGPQGIALDAAGNLYIADISNNRIRKVNTSGIISTIAGNGMAGFSGDGGNATAAELNQPWGVAIDVSGNVYIADENNNRVRKVNTAGIINTVAGNGTNGYTGNGGNATAAGMNGPVSVALDAVGNLYIADAGDHCIRMVTTAGIISTVAGNGFVGFLGDGGPATAAYLYSPNGVTFDASGNLFISDYNNNNIRKVNTAGIISTIAGNGTGTGTSYCYTCYAGDGGLATAAELYNPIGITFDASGNLYIADYDNNRVRKVNAPITVSSTTICIGNTATLSVNATNAYAYNWSTGETTSSINPSPTVTTVYTVTSTYTVSGSAIIYTTTATPTVTVLNSVPTLSLTGNTYTICNNSSQLFTSNGASSYTWSPGVGLTNSNIANPTASPTSTTIYTLTGGNACGIGSPLTLTVNVNPAPVINSQSGNVYACEGSSHQFTLNSSGSSNTYQWNWIAVNSPSDSIPDDGTLQELNYNTNSMTINPINNSNWGPSGTYAVLCVVTNSANCTAQSLPDTIFINPIPTLTVTTITNTICAGSTTTLTASGANTYTWSNTGALGASISPSPTVTTNYTVTGTDVNGCMNNDTLSVIVENCTTDIYQIAGLNSQISIYPNPNNGLFNLTISQFDNLKMNHIEIYNVTGECVHRQIAASANCQIDLSSLNEGVYNLCLQSSEGVVNKRLVIVR